MHPTYSLHFLMSIDSNHRIIIPALYLPDALRFVAVLIPEERRAFLIHSHAEHGNDP